MGKLIEREIYKRKRPFYSLLLVLILLRIHLFFVFSRGKTKHDPKRTSRAKEAKCKRHKLTIEYRKTIMRDDERKTKAEHLHDP